MTSVRRVAGSAVVLTALLGLTACNGDDPVVPSATGSSKASSSTSSSSSATAPSSSSSKSDAPSSSAATSAKPASKDAKSAFANEQGRIPPGPVTSIDVKLLGGYGNDTGFGEFYSVLDVNSTEPGLMKLKYELLDSSGKVLGRVNTSIAVAGTGRELKVTRASGKLPPASSGTVAKVRLMVTENSSNSFATVTQIEPNSLKIGQDPDTKSPTVSGRYRTVGKGSVISMNVICVDAAGLVQSDSTPVSKITAPDWTPFTAEIIYAKVGFKPKTCYVGT